MGVKQKGPFKARLTFMFILMLAYYNTFIYENQGLL